MKPERRPSSLMARVILLVALVASSCTRSDADLNTEPLTSSDIPLVSIGDEVVSGISATYATTRVAVDWARFSARTNATVLEVRVWAERGGELLGDCRSFVQWCDIRPLPVRDHVTVELAVSGEGGDVGESIWFDLPNLMSTSASPLPRDLGEVERMRDDLRVRILGTASTSPVVTVVDSDDSCPDVLPVFCTAFAGEAEISALLIEMDHGITSVVAVLEPVGSNGQAVIWHRGHEPDLGTVPSFKDAVRAFINRGTTVYVVSMLLFPPNPSHLVVDIPGRGTAIAAQHDDLFLLESQGASPLRFFVQPALAAVDHARRRGADVEVIGISGGGWTAVLVAAVDGNIGRTTSIAGSVPVMEMLGTAPYLPDYEQRLPGLFPDFDYPTLYAMGSLPGRHLRLVYNDRDPCCFALREEPAWFSPLREAVVGLGGKVEIFINDSDEHDVRPDMLVGPVIDD